MKLTATLTILASANNYAGAFSPTIANSRRLSTTTAIAIGRDSNVDLGGNTWKPDSEKMGSTDTGDYFPEGYDPNSVDFTEGMGASPGFGGERGPQLPGMEPNNDAVMMGGIEEVTDIPAGMEFVMSSVPDGEVGMNVAASSKGAELLLSIKPVCMGFEDFYCAFTPDSHQSFSVSPNAGRMDRRGGEPTELTVNCQPTGQAGEFIGNLVINLPEDNSKICYKIVATSF